MARAKKGKEIDMKDYNKKSNKRVLKHSNITCLGLNLLEHHQHFLAVPF
jgi:hypothetical protein